jgi:hypothetical protein
MRSRTFSRSLALKPSASSFAKRSRLRRLFMSPAISFSKIRDVGSQNSPLAPSMTVTVSGTSGPLSTIRW